MSEAHGDGLLDEAESNMRMALMGDSQLAQVATRVRTESHERASRRDLEVARQLQVRLEAEKVAARAEIASVRQASWWDQAARDAESRIRQELRDRYSIDVNETGADPSVVQVSLAEQDSGQRGRRPSVDDQKLAVGLSGAEALDLEAGLEDARRASALRVGVAEVEHGNAVTWDSAERREAHVGSIQQGEDLSLAGTAWKQADIDQARHPAEALFTDTTRSTKSRPTSLAPDTKMIGRDSR
ncbi:MAG: hypothetical protein ACOH2T_28990 [Pseudomonas sp.]